jgi:hypothetical protein
MILPVVLYGRETLPFTPREEYRLKVSGNRVLRIIFGLRNEEVVRSWRRLHNEKLHKL